MIEEFVLEKWSTCSLCFGHNETADHALLSAHFATAVWKKDIFLVWKGYSFKWYNKRVVLIFIWS